MGHIEADSFSSKSPTIFVRKAINVQQKFKTKVKSTKTFSPVYSDIIANGYNKTALFYAHLL